MEIKIKIKLFWKILYIFIPFIISAGFYILSIYMDNIVKILPPCIIYSHFHILCPGCGNTRSVAALLRGDILGSLRYNVTIPLLCLLAVIYYIEGLTYIFGRPVVIIPRKIAVLIIILSILIIYYILRNFFPLF